MLVLNSLNGQKPRPSTKRQGAERRQRVWGAAGVGDCVSLCASAISQMTGTNPAGNPCATCPRDSGSQPHPEPLLTPAPC